MNVPKYVLERIRKIEGLSYTLSLYEKELYDWLELHGINPEDESLNDSISIDDALNSLMTCGDGNQLIKYIETFNKEG